MSDEFVKTMNATADGTPRDIQAATDDSTFERKAKDLVKLYQVSDASGFLEINEVGNYPLKRDMLDTNVSLSTVFNNYTSLYYRMPSLLILALVVSLLGLASVQLEMRRRLLSRMLS